MIYITGDTHGDISCFKNPKLNKLGEKDILIVCGDFGFIWNPHDKNEKKNLEFLKKRAAILTKLPTIFTILCVGKFSPLKARAFLLWAAEKATTLI